MLFLFSFTLWYCLLNLMFLQFYSEICQVSKFTKVLPFHSPLFTFLSLFSSFLLSLPPSFFPFFPLLFLPSLYLTKVTLIVGRYRTIYVISRKRHNHDVYCINVLKSPSVIVRKQRKSTQTSTDWNRSMSTPTEFHISNPSVEETRRQEGPRSNFIIVKGPLKRSGPFLYTRVSLGFSGFIQVSERHLYRIHYKKGKVTGFVPSVVSGTEHPTSSNGLGSHSC